MLRHSRAVLVTAAALGMGVSLAPAAQAVDSVAIPLPPIRVQEVCGPRNDILTVDPAWLAAWGDKVVIYPASLTFQSGPDGETAKPSGQILQAYRSTYHWEGSGTGWDSWDLYPGTITPIVDANTPCITPVAAPVLTQTEVRGPRNDVVAFADTDSAAHWTIVSQTWQGQRLTVTLQAKDGFVGPDGATTITQVFTDAVNRGS